MAKHQPIVEELKTLLKVRPGLKRALKESIRRAGRLDVLSLTEYYEFLDDMVTMIPTERDLLPQMLEFYYLVDQAPHRELQQEPLFQQWLAKFAEEWGRFLDTPESTRGLETFYTDPSYNIDDYFVGPSGWLTFNQFFARQIRPGKRPIAGLCDDSIVVSPADSVFMGQWKIDEQSDITVKGLKWSVQELLDGSPYQHQFEGGIYMHSFLNVNDYHRYHVPVRGTIKEVRNISGRVSLDVIEKDSGALAVVDGATYQFTQERGLIIIDSPVGLVAVLPIGMAQVSSVNLTPEKGAELAKGDEFGYFLFGGSDIVMMFQANRVQLTAEVGTHYKQGTQIGHALGP